MTGLFSALVLIAVAALIARHLIRAFFYPKPMDFPEIVESDIDAAIRRFEMALATHAPQVLEALQPGLSDEQIDAIEREHRLTLTDDLRVMYRWRSGSQPDSLVDLIPGHHFIPLDEAASPRKVLRSQVAATTSVQRLAYAVFAGHRNGWLTVLDDRAGDGYFYDPHRRRRSGYFFYHFSEVHEYRFFPSLANFVNGAAECYENRIYRIGHHGSANENYERSIEVWGRYSTLYDIAT